MEPDQIKEAIARLSPERRAILEQKLQSRGTVSALQKGIPRRPDPDEYPLSPAQERLWRLNRLRPNDPVYNLGSAWRLRGRVNTQALAAAFAAIVERHDPLRARFADVNGRCVQTLRLASDFDMSTIVCADDADDVVQRQVHDIAKTPFDLANDPLFRVTLLRIGTMDHVLVVTAHHMVSDGWSMEVLAKELTTAYHAALSGADIPLKSPAVTYHDVAAWMSERAASGEHLEFWRQTLSGRVEALRLPSRGSAVYAGIGGASLSFVLDPALVHLLEVRAASMRVTPFAFLLAAYQLTLHRITGQERLVLCTPVAARDHVDTEPLIGYFNNLVPLAGEVERRATISETVARAARTVSEAFDHAAANFQDVAALPETATIPLTRGLFVLQGSEAPCPRLTGVEVMTLELATESSDFDLAIYLRPRQEAIRGVALYRPASITSEAVGTIIDGFDSTLRLMLDEPDSSVGDLQSIGIESEPQTPVGNRPGDKPASLVEARLARIWRTAFGRDVGCDDDFFDMGGHSLLAADLIAAIEQEFDLEALPLSTLFEAPTIAQFATLLHDEADAPGWESLVPIKTEGDRPPLFFVHAHGGNVIGYADLARHLSSRQPLYGLQSPRVQSGPRRIEDMAASYLAEVRTVQPDGPYVVGGWCLGGDVALEMGRQLRDDGASVALVLMVDNPRQEHLHTSSTGMRRVLDRVATRLEMEWSNVIEVAPGRRARFVKERVGRLAQRAGVAVERAATDRGGRLPLNLDHSRAYRQEHVAATHEKAYEAYLPEPYDGRVAIFRAEQQPRGRADDPTLGWSEYLNGPVDPVVLPGHRIGMLSEPRIRRGAPMIEAAIARALDEHVP